MSPTMIKITTMLILFGALHLGLVGAFGVDLITNIFGTGILPKVVHVLIGVSVVMHVVTGTHKKLVS